MESNNHVVMFQSDATYSCFNFGRDIDFVIVRCNAPVSAKQICFLYFIEAVNWRHNRWYTYVNREGLGS